MHTGRVLTSGRSWLIGYTIWSLFVSGWFFVDGMSADLSDLSGDQINILTIAARKDYPHLLRRDLVVAIRLTRPITFLPLSTR